MFTCYPTAKIMFRFMYGVLQQLQITLVQPATLALKH
jgi:hypothetical protein